MARGVNIVETNESAKAESTRAIITLPKELKEKLKVQAKKESRSLSNLILAVLQRYSDTLEG